MAKNKRMSRKPTVKISPPRRRRKLRARKSGKITSFKIDLDMITVPVIYTGNIFGWSGKKPDELHIKIFDCSGKHVKPFGAIRLTYRQWRELSKFGNRMFRGHRRVARDIAAKAKKNKTER